VSGDGITGSAGDGLQEIQGKLQPVGLLLIRRHGGLVSRKRKKKIGLIDKILRFFLAEVADLYTHILA
jgi:hypothetical protein